MAVVSLNKSTFTQVAIPAKSLVQFRGGIAEVSAAAAPAAGDWVSFTSGDMFVAEKAFYARGVGSVVTLAL